MQEPNLKCGVCGQSFASERERREHEAAEHSAEVREKRAQLSNRSEEETAA